MSLLDKIESQSGLMRKSKNGLLVSCDGRKSDQKQRTKRLPKKSACSYWLNVRRLICYEGDHLNLTILLKLKYKR